MKKEYKFGSTGFVELINTKAKKYMVFDKLYWLREYSILYYLWLYDHSNIIRYENGCYITTRSPETDKLDTYYELDYPRIDKILYDVRVTSDKLLLQILVDLLSAVALCHSLKIWHRDIKPENVLIKDNRAILIDFTHAIRIRTDEISLDRAVVTYTHRAPEVFNEDPYTEKIDIWSLGILLFETLVDTKIEDLIFPCREHVFKKLYCEADYMKKLLDIYKNTHTPFKYTTKYLGWVKSMLEFEAHKRPSASQLLDEIFEFANSKDINLVLPTWNDAALCIRKYTKTIKLIDASNEDLLKDSLELADHYDTKFHMSFNIDMLSPVFKYLIYNKTITEQNKIEMVLAICICLNVVIYDNIISLNTISNHGFNKSPIIDCIVELMQKNEKVLFFSNYFDFYGPLSKMCSI